MQRYSDYMFACVIHVHVVDTIQYSLTRYFSGKRSPSLNMSPFLSLLTAARTAWRFSFLFLASSSTTFFSSSSSILLGPTDPPWQDEKRTYTTGKIRAVSNEWKSATPQHMNYYTCLFTFYAQYVHMYLQCTLICTACSSCSCLMLAGHARTRRRVGLEI